MLNQKRWIFVGGLVLVCWLNGFAGYWIKEFNPGLARFFAVLILGVLDFSMAVFMVRLGFKRQAQVANLRETLGWIQESFSHQKPRLEQHLEPDSAHMLQQFTNRLQTALRKSVDKNSKFSMTHGIINVGFINLPYILSIKEPS